MPNQFTRSNTPRDVVHSGSPSALCAIVFIAHIPHETTSCWWPCGKTLPKFSKGPSKRASNHHCTLRMISVGGGIPLSESESPFKPFAVFWSRSWRKASAVSAWSALKSKGCAKCHSWIALPTVLGIFCSMTVVQLGSWLVRVNRYAAIMSIKLPDISSSSRRHTSVRVVVFVDAPVILIFPFHGSTEIHACTTCTAGNVAVGCIFESSQIWHVLHRDWESTTLYISCQYCTLQRGKREFL